MLLIIAHHLIIIIEKNKFLVLGEGPTQDINDSTGAAENKLVLTLKKQIKNFAYVCITMVILELLVHKWKKDLQI